MFVISIEHLKRNKRLLVGYEWRKLTKLIVCYYKEDGYTNGVSGLGTGQGAYAAGARIFYSPTTYL